MRPNAHVQAQLDALTAAWWQGYDDGYHAPALPLPGFYVKPYSQFTAYERGYVFGVEMRTHEMDKLP